MTSGAGRFRDGSTSNEGGFLYVRAAALPVSPWGNLSFGNRLGAAL